ncbi:MAG: nuclear transport factor 2 family protein [Gemmatimonadales bacterium]|jgi:ketosteroid isomerase-like protein
MEGSARERDRADFDALIRQFGEAWSAGDAAAMAQVFRPDGVFRPEPFAAPVNGRAAIQEYWKDIPFEQSEIAFRYGEIFSVGPWFAVEFKCTFRRRRTGELVDVRGALFCETGEGEVAEMRMYWHRVIGGRKK